MNLTQLEQTESELKRRKNRDITNQWQFRNYVVFILGCCRSWRPWPLEPAAVLVGDVGRGSKGRAELSMSLRLGGLDSHLPTCVIRDGRRPLVPGRLPSPRARHASAVQAPHGGRAEAGPTRQLQQRTRARPAGYGGAGEPSSGRNRRLTRSQPWWSSPEAKKQRRKGQTVMYSRNQVYHDVEDKEGYLMVVLMSECDG